MGIDTIIGVIGIGVGALSVIFSWLAWSAAKTASHIARETQQKLGSVRFAGEIERLRSQVQNVSRAVREAKWEYACEKCSEVTALYGELTSRFDPLPKAVQSMDFAKHRTQFFTIAKTCNILGSGQVRSIPNLTTEIDEQIAFLSEVLGKSDRDLEKKVVYNS